MNRGVDLEREIAEQRGDEWKFGAASPACVFAVSLKDRSLSLPNGELQQGLEDFSDCVTRAYLNILETKFTYRYRANLIKEENAKWLFEKGYVTFRDGLPYVEFSDRFTAIKGGTTRTGASLKAPAQAIHQYGLIPKFMLPKEPTMRFDDYHDPSKITPEMEEIGKQFLRRFAINYEQVSVADLDALLTMDMANIAVCAWPEPQNGEYPRTDGPFNHAVMAFGLPRTFIFDNYPETYSDSREWVKKIAANYKIYDYGYRIYVSSETTEEERRIQLTIFQVLLKYGLISFFAEAWRRFWKPAIDTSPTVPPVPAPAPESNRERLHEEALLSIGTDASPLDHTPDEFGCAESLSLIVRRAFPDFKAPFTSTIDLAAYLDKRTDLFKRTIIYKPGCIIVSPRVGTVPGHCGFFTDGSRIISNDSKSGLMQNNYSWNGWVQEFKDRRGLRIFIWEPL